MNLHPIELDPILIHALREDIRSGDITTKAVIPADLNAEGAILAKEEGIVCGLPVVERVFALLDSRVHCEALVEEGVRIASGDVVMRLTGPARAILTGERVALNFLQRLSGIATKTARFVQLVAGYPVRITDTRKTTPGLRLLERYAVSTGGGFSHRFALDDSVLLKDNHIAIAGSIRQAVATARDRVSHTMKIEVEVETLDQLREALESGADIILLDNMEIPTLTQAVQMTRKWTRGESPTPVQTITQALHLAHKWILLEASGGINEENARAIAATGVDILSIGELTHSANAVDYSLEIENRKA